MILLTIAAGLRTVKGVLLPAVATVVVIAAFPDPVSAPDAFPPGGFPPAEV
jgi:hypothetical protein